LPLTDITGEEETSWGEGDSSSDEGIREGGSRYGLEILKERKENYFLEEGLMMIQYLRKYPRVG
jgi:hypothetical protein